MHAYMHTYIYNPCDISRYFNYKVDLDVSIEDRQIDMNSIVPLLEFKSTQELKEIVEKSRSRLFKDSQYVVADFSGTLNIQELAFYEVRRLVCMYVRSTKCVLHTTYRACA